MLCPLRGVGRPRGTLPLGRPSATSRALQDALHHCMQPWLWAKPLLGSMCRGMEAAMGTLGASKGITAHEGRAVLCPTSLSSFFPIFSLYFSLCFVLCFSLHFSFSGRPYSVPYTFSYPLPYSISYAFPYAFPYPFSYHFLNVFPMFFYLISLIFSLQFPYCSFILPCSLTFPCTSLTYILQLD